MSLKINEIQKIKTLDDLVFEKRNKRYGAFDLRHQSNRYSLKGFVIVFLVLASSFGASKLHAYLNPVPEIYIEKPKEPGVVIFNVVPEEPEVTICGGKIFEEILPSVEKPLWDQFELVDAEVANPTFAGAIPTPPSIGGGLGDGSFNPGAFGKGIKMPESSILVLPELKKPVIEPEIKELVDEEAFYPGGYENYFKANFKMSTIDIESGVKGTVRVRFVVDKLGLISNVEMIKGLTGTVNKEVIRTLMSMPAWMPGRISGDPVTSRQELTIFIQ